MAIALNNIMKTHSFHFFNLTLDLIYFILLGVLKCIRSITTLPYFGKRKQVTKVTFLVKEQNVSAISTDVNGIL